MQKAYRTYRRKGQKRESILNDPYCKTEKETVRNREQWKVLKGTWWRKTHKESIIKVPLLSL